MLEYFAIYLVKQSLDIMHVLVRNWLLIALFCVSLTSNFGIANAQEALFQQKDLRILYGDVQRPNGMTWFNEKLYVACTGDWTVYEIDVEAGTTRTYIFGVQNANSLYAELGTDNLTQLWVPDFVTNEFLRIHPNSSPTTILDEGLAGGWGLDYLDEDRFILSNLLADTVIAVSRFGEVETLVERLRSPTGLVLDGGAFYVANTGSVRRSIEWFTLRQIAAQDEPLNATEVNNALLVGGLQNVTGLALAEDSWLYFAYSEGALGVVGRVNPHDCRDKGGCQADEVEVVVRTALAAPLAGLTLSPDGRLFFHSLYKPEIYWLQLPALDSTHGNSLRESGS